MSHQYCPGQLKYDKFHLVWTYDGDKWIPVTDPKNGEQIQYSDSDLAKRGFRFPQFTAAEDPSGEDPRTAVRLIRIEAKLDRIEAKLDALAKRIG